MDSTDPQTEPSSAPIEHQSPQSGEGGSADSPMLFVTGATGFLGTAILRQAALQEICIHAVGRSLAESKSRDGLEFSQLDLTSDELSADLLSGCDQVLHVAGLAHQFGKRGDERDRFEQVNVGAVKRVAEAAGKAGINHFVLISSVGVYGEGEGVRPEQAACHPEGHYAISKFDGEKAAQDVCGRYGMTLTILRMATLYGEQDRGNVQRLIEGIDRGVIPFFGAGQNRKSLVHVQDAAAACLKVAHDFRTNRDQTNNGTGTAIFNVAGEPKLMRDVYRDIRLGLGKSTSFVRIPMTCVRLPFQILSGVPGVGSIATKVVLTLDKWSRDDAYDGSKFQQHFGFTPSVGLQTGVGRQTRWYRLHRQDLFRRRLAKRVFDFVLAAGLLIAFSVPMMIVAALVKLTSPGPIVYFSDRVGKNNRLFPMPKFRTMRIDTPQVATHLLGDSAKWLTPIGNLLRKTSLDELPQLFSVLKGHMSFVGPRPALFNQDDLIGLRDQAGVSRLKPGITGWAQINGRDDLSLPEKVVYDQQYVLQRSMVGDIKIIVATALQAFIGKGVRSADEADGISAWQTMQPSANRSKTIVTDPQSVLLVSEAVAAMGWDVSIHSIRKADAFADLIEELTLKQHEKTLLLMPKHALEQFDASLGLQRSGALQSKLTTIVITDDACWNYLKDQQVNTLARMDLIRNLKDHQDHSGNSA